MPTGTLRPMRLYRVVGGVGRTLVSVGVLLLLFVAYQLWGTGIAQARAQDSLRSEFEAVLRTTTTSTTAPPAIVVAGSTTDTTGTTVAPPRPPPPPPPVEGESVAFIRIPKIGVDQTVVSGVSVADLKEGPGHYPDTPLPGQAGNAAIAGHRTTYGAPFQDLDQLVVGDTIEVVTRQGPFSYRVDRTDVVRPSEVQVLAPTPEARLTLTTCNPKFSARERLIVSAVLEQEPAPSAPVTSLPVDDRGDDGEPPVDGAEPEVAGPDGADPDDVEVTEEEEEAEATLSFEEPSLSGDRANAAPTVLWAAVCAVIALAAWGLGRLWRRWPVYVLATPVFLFALFVCFENVARLFPANV